MAGKGAAWRIVAAVIALNLGLLIFSVMLMSSGGERVALAQDDKTDPVDDGTRFDVYPHPLSRGALAYSLADSWDTTDLTYYIANCPSTINCNDGHDAVRAAFQAWQEVSVLTFNEVSSARQADIQLEWAGRGPEVGYPGGVLGYATFPRDGGDIVFDDAEPWSVFDGSEFDLFLVATHEIGHALGLNHSSVPYSLMYPVLTGQTTGLTDDDIAAIQALYGTPQQAPQNIPPTEGGETLSGTISDQIPYELWEFEAFAGETLTITMETVSGNLEPYVAILTNDEQTVLVESAGSGGIAQVTYTFEQDGTYVIAATRQGVEEGFTSGDYVLDIDVAEQGAPVPDDDTGLLDVNVRSYTSFELCEVYVSPTTEEFWGENLLDGTLTYGNVIPLALPPGLYDVLAVGCDGTQIEEYELDINAPADIEIYDNDVNVYVFGN